jgi:uncharacterized membrane protein
MTAPRQPGRVVPGPSQGALSGLRWWPFIILAGAGAVVFLGGGRQGPATGPLRTVWGLMLAISLAIAVILEVMARACVNRQRLAAGFDASPEAARAILDASAGLTRVVNLAISVFMSLLVVPQAWLPGIGRGERLGLATAILLAAITWSVWSLKSVHHRLERTGQLGGLEGWNGFVYSNAKDPRLWVPKLSGLGGTLNFAHVRAWLILGVILALPLGAVAVGLLAALRR